MLPAWGISTRKKENEWLGAFHLLTTHPSTYTVGKAQHWVLLVTGLPWRHGSMERTASPRSVRTDGSTQLKQCCFDSTHLKDREPLLKVLFAFQRITRMLCLQKVHRWKSQQYTKGGCFGQINHIMGTISSQSRPISLQRSDETCFLPLHHVRTQESTSYEVWVLFRHWLYKHFDPGLFTLPMWEIHTGSLDPAQSEAFFLLYQQQMDQDRGVDLAQAPLLLQVY